MSTSSKPSIVEQLFPQVLSQLPKESEGLPWPDSETPCEYGLHWDLSRRLAAHRKIVPYRDWKSTIDAILTASVPDLKPNFDRAGRQLEPAQHVKDWVEGGIRWSGLETLAFYKSPRHITLEPFPGQWGIFYLSEALEYLAYEFARECSSYTDPFETAYQFLRAHERFHFQADIQTLMFEAVLKRHLYIPLRKAMRRRPHDFVEEALANQKGYEWIRKKAKRLEDYVSDFMHLQPGAYARFEEDTLALQGEWAANVLDLLPPRCSPRQDVAHWIGLAPKHLLKTNMCPEWVVESAPLSQWVQNVVILPPVRSIVDDIQVQKVLGTKYVQLGPRWEKTKRYLIENPRSRGLNFKPWKEKSVYSARVGDKFRAHLRNIGDGAWVTIAIGGHTEMGHG
jgi:hypothetical protein